MIHASSVNLIQNPRSYPNGALPQQTERDVLFAGATPSARRQRLRERKRSLGSEEPEREERRLGERERSQREKEEPEGEGPKRVTATITNQPLIKFYKSIDSLQDKRA